jgi:predicted ATP-dependent Lon-type protease
MAPFVLGIVFPEMGLKGDGLWSMLYLAGYLTTDETALPNDTLSLRPLRIPNREVALLYRAEIVGRFLGTASP